MGAPVTTMATWSIWKEVTDTRGDRLRWKEDRKKQTLWLQPLQIPSIHKARGETRCVTCFHLLTHVGQWWDLVSDVHRHWVCQLSASPPKTLIHTRKLQLPFPIHPPAILFYFSGAFLKAHLSNTKDYWAPWNRTESKQQRGSSHSEERDHRSGALRRVRGWMLETSHATASFVLQNQ